MTKEILVNQLFAGKYLSEGDNIGHEVINLFEDDRGDHYLYVTPSGMVKWHDVESVVFVRNVHARKTVEVIALGIGLSPVESGAVPNIQYGGVPLSQIFRGNTYHGKEDIFSGNVTYLAREVLVPADNRIFISVEPGFDLSLFPKSVLLNSSKKVVVPQSLRSYYSSENEPEAYRQLRKMISDKSLWKPVGAAGKLVTDGLSGGRRPTFLEIIGKEDDELAFSNLLAYYFNLSHASFREFALGKELLGLPDMDLDFSITRESNHHVDIWIESDSRVIVIENKIRSGVNGFDGDRSQLDKYRANAEAYALEHGKQACFYVFVPDYNNTEFSKFDPEGTWKIVPYSAIHSFFAQNAANYIEDWYFPEFLRALERQTMTMAELNFRTMRSRFIKKIAQAQ